MLDISIEFQSVIAELKQGKRPNRVYNEKQISVLSSELETVASARKWEELIPILCIIDNTISLSQEFHAGLIDCIRNCENTEVLVLALGVSRKQITEECHKRSQRVPFEFIEELERLLESKDPEVLEWTLRLIEGLGSQSRYFKDKISKSRPGITALFNAHKKSSQQIIDMLQKRWN